MLCFTPQSEPNGCVWTLEMMQLDYINSKGDGSGMKSPRFVEGLDKRTCFDDVDGVRNLGGNTHLQIIKNLNLHIFLEKWREAWHIQWVFYTYFVQQVPS